MAPNSQEEQSFIKKHSYPEEAKLLKKLKSPYIIEYEECFFEGMNVFIVTEYCKVKFHYFFNNTILYKSDFILK